MLAKVLDASLNFRLSFCTLYLLESIDNKLKYSKNVGKVMSDYNKNSIDSGVYGTISYGTLRVTVAVTQVTLCLHVVFSF